MILPPTTTRSDCTVVLTQLFVAHHRRLVGLASLLVDDRGAAEEVVQDALLALHRRWRQLRDPTSAVAYLNVCVVNGSRRRSQRERRRLLLAPRVSAAAEQLDSAEDTAVEREQLAVVRAGIRDLPRRQREVLVLRYFLDLSEAEIAETLDISRGSVKSHASRGLASLARRLEVTS